MGGADAETWLTGVKLIGGAIAALLIGLAGLITGRRAGAHPPAVEGEVVAASFTERAQLERLITALATLDATIAASTETSGRLVDLLERDEQRRHDEAVVREALRKHGITTKD